MTLTSVIGHSINTTKTVVDVASIIGAFVYVYLAKVSFVARKALASVIDQWIQALGAVEALVIVANATHTDFHVIKFSQRAEFTSRWIVQQLLGREEWKQKATDAEFIEATAEVSRRRQDQSSRC